MYSKKKTGITLMENMVTIVLLSVLVMTTIGGFIVAKTGAIRAKHRTIAMGLIKEYMEKEVLSGYYSGQYSTFASGTAVTTAIDGITYSIMPDPYPAGSGPGEALEPYKIIGFRVMWDEPIYGNIGSVSCSEQAGTYVARHW
jgi:type II secretory pathway pseudopilin PulG